jgi:peptidoglycan hydrolase-like protein with peptidoglycan-binding domain
MGCRLAKNWVAAALVCLFSAFVVFPLASARAQNPIVVAQSDISEKEAYEAAKELGTIEAWEAFLNNFPKGFRADLAKAYLKRIANEAPKTTQPTQAVPPPPAPPVEIAAPPPPPPPPPSPADISLTQTANQASCNGGDTCSYTVVATNTGGTVFTGQLVIANSLAPRGANLTSTGNAPWYCQGMGGGAICTNPGANLAPGASTNLSLTFTLPRNSGGSVTSCSSISWGGAPTASGVRDVQQALNNRGLNAGPADGQPGRKTVTAIRAFQNQNGLQATGEIDLPLLMALFSVPGTGDANPQNDQACAGSAVFSTAPQPVSNWRPPSGYSKPKRTGTGGKCSSRSVWLEGQCILKSQVASFCGPGFSRQGSRCVSNAGNQFGSDGHLLNKLPGCPANTVRVGNSCVRQNTAPLFGNLFQGGTTPTSTSGGTQTQSGGNQVRTGGSAPCPYPYKRNTAGKCDIVCSGGRIRYIQANGQPSCKCRAGTVLTTTQGGWYSVCLPPGQKKPNTKCPPGQVADLLNQSRCFPACSGGKVRMQGICCAPGSGVTNGRCTYFDKNQQTACKPGFTREDNWCRKNTGGLPQQVNVPQGGNCVSNQVRLANGACGCPSNKPRWSKGKCKKQKGINQFLNQAQPQNQQQQVQTQNTCPAGKEWRSGKCRSPKPLNQILKQLQQPQQTQQRSGTQQRQQQQQLQIPGLGGITISDRRLKRDVAHLATREDGLKLYSFRYLWSDEAYVGVMAQDLLVDPARTNTVSRHGSGYYMVDYGKLGLKMLSLEEWQTSRP